MTRLKITFGEIDTTIDQKACFEAGTSSTPITIDPLTVIFVFNIQV
jgi:hypothetical protein